MKIICRWGMPVPSTWLCNTCCESHQLFSSRPLWPSGSMLLWRLSANEVFRTGVWYRDFIGRRTLQAVTYSLAPCSLATRTPLNRLHLVRARLPCHCECISPRKSILVDPPSNTHSTLRIATSTRRLYINYMLPYDRHNAVGHIASVG